LPPSSGAAATAAVVGAGVIGLSAARALAAEGVAVTVYEQHRVGTPLGSSPHRSRIFRISYPREEYVRLARPAIEEWERLDGALLLRNGLLEHGAGVERNAAAMEACDEPHRWLEPAEATRLFPEARFDEPVLWHADAGAVLADDALVRLRGTLDVREGVRIDDPRALGADIVVVCAGAWLGDLFDLPLKPQLEQVAYVRGPSDTRPSVIHHGRPGDPTWYGLVAPGSGYKIAQDNAQPQRFDPNRPDRPVTADLLDRTRAHVLRAFPGLDPEPYGAESCLYTMTPDGDFILDRIDGVVVCGGDSGHAFKFGPLLGRLVADLALGRTLPPETAMWRADRFAGMDPGDEERWPPPTGVTAQG
jgi:sarcosine oxidase